MKIIDHEGIIFIFNEKDISCIEGSKWSSVTKTYTKPDDGIYKEYRYNIYQMLVYVKHKSNNEPTILTYYCKDKDKDLRNQKRDEILNNIYDCYLNIKV